MAHGSVPLAGTPQKLDLAEGAPHWVQNLGDGPMYVQAVTGNTAPTDLDAARFVIPPKGSLVLTAHAGESTFAWGSHGGLVGHSQTPGAGAVIPAMPKPQFTLRGTVTQRTPPGAEASWSPPNNAENRILLGSTQFYLNVVNGHSNFIQLAAVSGNRAWTGATQWLVILINGTEVGRRSVPATGRSPFTWPLDFVLATGDSVEFQVWDEHPPGASATFSGTAGGSAPFTVRWSQRSPSLIGGSGSVSGSVRNASSNRIRVQWGEQNSDSFTANGRWWVLKVNGTEQGRAALPDVGADGQVNQYVANAQLGASDAVVMEIWPSEPPAA